MSIEAMKQALEALEWNLPVIEDWGGKDNLNLQHKAITALRQAIEQAEVASSDTSQKRVDEIAKQRHDWVGLTDEEVSKIIDNEIGFNSCWGPEEAFARAIEAKLKEKNT